MSNATDAIAAQRSVSSSRNHSAIEVRKFASAAWPTRTPLGRPVDPEV